jgi:hypothetical protein
MSTGATRAIFGSENVQNSLEMRILWKQKNCQCCRRTFFTINKNTEKCHACVIKQH